jgi:hypothetical protein
MAGVDASDGNVHIAGDGGYAVEVVSGSSHQDRLEWLAQGRGEEPVDYTCTALLLPEPNNPFDPNAVSVSIRGVRVGYLPADAAASMAAAMQMWGFERATCAAIVEGGWYRSTEDKGDFCVRLDANPDFAPTALALAAAERMPPRPAAVVAAAGSGKATAYDLGLGAVATFALLALIGIVWLIVQPIAQPTGPAAKADYPAATAQFPARPHDAALGSADGDRERLERMALLNSIGRPQSTSDAGQAVTTEARHDPMIVVAQAERPPDSRRPTAQPGGPRQVIAVTEAAKEALAVPPPDAAATANDAAAVARVPPAASAGEERLSLAALGPRDAEEIGKDADRWSPVAVASPSAVEVQPRVPAAGVQGAVPATPAAPASARGDNGVSAGAGPVPAAGPAAADAKPAARPPRRAESRRKARFRAEPRAARLKARSRNTTRFSRRNRRAVEAAPPPSPSPAPAAPAPQTVEPGLLPAARMLQGWSREWRAGTAVRPAVQWRPVQLRPVQQRPVQQRPAQQ